MVQYKGKVSKKPSGKKHTPKTDKVVEEVKVEQSTTTKEGKVKKFKAKSKLKLWQKILIIVIAVLIVLGVVGAIIFNDLRNRLLGGEIPEPDGVETHIGTFTETVTREYVLSEYTEHFSGDQVWFFQKGINVRFNGKSFYYVISENGVDHYELGGEYTGDVTPEALKQQVLDDIQDRYGYTDENIVKCQVPVMIANRFTQVKINKLVVTENSVSLTYQAAIRGEALSDEYTLTGTYANEDGVFAFTFTNLPTDEVLKNVAEKVLSSAKYTSISEYGSWVNKFTFANEYVLTLVTE